MISGSPALFGPFSRKKFDRLHFCSLTAFGFALNLESGLGSGFRMGISKQLETRMINANAYTR